MEARSKELLFTLLFAVGGVLLLAKALGHWGAYQHLGRLRRGPRQPIGQLGRGTAPGDESLQDARGRSAGVIRTVTGYRVKDIKERVSLIAGLARRDYLKPEIREAALGILTRKCGEGPDRRWCTAQKDWREEVRAIYEASTDPKSPFAVRYTMDPVGVDMYTAPSATQRLRGEDCDSIVALVAARLMSVGYSPRAVVIATPKSPGGDYSHILLQVPAPQTSTDGSVSGSEDFVVVDASMPEKGWGWEPPGLTDAIRTNRPSGIISKMRIYKI